MVPNAFTLPDVHPDRWAPEDISDTGFLDTDTPGHGTQVASIAAGTKYGIAPKADLYLIKGSNVWNSVDSDGKFSRQMGLPTPDAWRASLEHVKTVVLARNLQGKAVVSFSFSGSLALPKYQDFEPSDIFSSRYTD